MPNGLFIALFGYILGSVPTGLLLTKYFSKIDPREHGSKNIGATNIFRIAGKSLGIITLIADVLKGAIPVLFTLLWADSHVWTALTGLTAVLGHVFPIFLGFKGGKGVATTLGSFVMISWPAVLFEMALFCFMVWKWRYVSLGSITCAIILPIAVAFFRGDSPFYFVAAIIVAALILYKHQTNIVRLLQGTENKWKM